MRAIIINADLGTVYEVNDAITLEYMQKTVGGYICVAGTIGRDVLYVDDEGMLKRYKRGFIYRGKHQPFFGNGIICGADNDGNTVSAGIPLYEVVQDVGFCIFGEPEE